MGLHCLRPKRPFMPVIVRPAYPSDAEAIARTHVACWEETYRGVLPDHALDVQTVETRSAQWTRTVHDDAASVFVADVDGEVVGFASALPNPDATLPYDAFLDTLYIRKRAQRLGIARLLLSAIARALLERGFRSMMLLTLRDRNAACAFYERIGAIGVREQPAPAVLGAGIMDRVYAFPDLRALVNE